VQADANSNGKIDKDEIAAFEKCLGIDEASKEKKKPGMKGYDQDGDGKVSAKEQQCGAEFDENKNGVIDKEEMPKFLACLKGAAGGYDGPDPDKTVSMAELKCGMAVDKNNNGVIDKDEMKAFEACLGISQKGKTGSGYDWDGDKVVSKEEQACAMIVDANGNGKIDENEKKAMIQCLKGAKGDYDQNKDGTLTPKELKCAMKADSNRNGKIDAKEVFDFEVCLGLKKGYDANGDGAVSKEEMACGKIVDANGNGKIDKEEMKAFMACLKGAKGDYDGEKDNKVSEAEMQCAAKADANHNGRIDKAEIAAFETCLEDVEMMDILSEYNAQAVKKDPHHPDEHGAENMLKNHAFASLFDCNKDGSLDEGEMKNAATAWMLAQQKAEESYYDMMDYAGYNGYYDGYYGEGYGDDDYYYDDAMGYYDDAGYYDESDQYEDDYYY